MLYTLADLTRFTGAKRRSAQLWAEGGVLIAEQQSNCQGTGTHRLFSRDEVIVACVVAAFALDSFPIGRLIQIAQSVRTVLQNQKDRDLVSQAIYDTDRVYLAYDQTGRPTFFSKMPLEFLLDEMNDSNVKSNIVFLNGCFARLRAAAF